MEVLKPVLHMNLLSQNFTVQDRSPAVLSRRLAQVNCSDPDYSFLVKCLIYERPWVPPNRNGALLIVLRIRMLPKPWRSCFFSFSEKTLYMQTYAYTTLL